LARGTQGGGSSPHILGGGCAGSPGRGFFSPRPSYLFEFGVGPSKSFQALVNIKENFSKSSKTALSGIILIPKWAF